MARSFRARTRMAVPPEVAFDYLGDPRRRPEWQSSLRSVTLADPGAEPHRDLAWVETMVIGVRPAMQIVEFQRPGVWAERGTWRGVEMTLRLTFEESDGGCLIVADGAIVGRRLYALPAVVAGTLAGLAIGGDLRKAKKIMERRA